MKAGCFTVGILAIGMCLAGGAEIRPLQLDLELTDGSRLKGALPESSIQVQTSFAKLEIPLHQVQTIDFKADHETVRVTLQNGDTVTGVMLTDQFAITGLLGKLSISAAWVSRMTVMTGNREGGLIAHWTFDDETGADRVGDNNAALVGGVTFPRALIGKAIRLTDRGTYARIDSPKLSVNGWPAITVAVWIKPVRYTTYGNVVSRGTDARGAGYQMSINQTFGGCFSLQMGPDRNEIVGFKSFGKEVRPYPSTDRWYHLVGTYDGQTIRCYVNGEPDGEVAVKQPGLPLWELDGAKTYIGTSSSLPFRDWTDQYFDGFLDEVRIWKRAVSPQEIKELYRDMLAQAERDIGTGYVGK